MSVMVASHISLDGSVISGDAPYIVIAQTDPGSPHRRNAREGLYCPQQLPKLGNLVVQRFWFRFEKGCDPGSLRRVTQTDRVPSD
ncbi:MAG: hypothetical protein QOE23_2019 [Pseudonocardiales bacterium]|jgi:hypothetical protein|nr:hypothetical protein [Pseudonocardiales bacterium]